MRSLLYSRRPPRFSLAKEVRCPLSSINAAGVGWQGKKRSCRKNFAENRAENKLKAYLKRT
jgi:hypothetical protein